MKKMNINKFLMPICLSVVSLFASCSMFDDFLTVPPTDKITGEEYWEDKADLTSIVASCYTNMCSENVIKRFFLWGELRSDNYLLNKEGEEDIKNIMNANLLPTNGWFNWEHLYKTIGYCNLGLAKGEEYINDNRDQSFSIEEWEPMRAELKAIRALNYFYLVRAFNNVPFVVKSNDTSNGAKDSVAQTSAHDILNYLIKDLDECKDEAMISYGNKVSDKGRITKKAVYAILADMYLWRAALGAKDTTGVYNPTEDYQKCIECCDFVINDVIKDFEEERETYYGSKMDKVHPSGTVIPAPLYICEKGSHADIPFNEIFGSKNSLESIFELQFDGTNNKNSAYGTFLGGESNGSFQPGTLTAANLFETTDDKADPKSKAFCKTDIRYCETIYKNASSQKSTIPISKFAMTRISTPNMQNVIDDNFGVGDRYKGSVRKTGDNDGNFIFYRVSEIMLMKAEALAAISDEDSEILKQAFDLVKAVYDRSNPEATNDAILKNEYTSTESMMGLILRERQRELFGEGKRWFDLVRYALYCGNTKSMLDILTVKYVSNSNAIKAKLSTINSLYNPIYNEEIKVNPALVQNPTWQTEEEVVRN